MNVTHPTWCDLARCEAAQAHNGAHTSTPRIMRPDGVSTARVQVRMWQRADHPTFVELTVGDHANGRRVRADLSLMQVFELCNTLGDLIGARLTSLGGTDANC